ncbi:MAG: hypothetical protein ACMUIG_08975 [Thermoplasmatota archaeon]
MTVRSNPYETISVERISRYLSVPMLERRDDGNIHVDINGSDETVYCNPKSGTPVWHGIGGWESCSADEISDVLESIIDSGRLMEIKVENPYGETNLLIDSPEGLSPFTEIMPYGDRMIEYRVFDRTGRRFLALFFSGRSSYLLGSIEMLKPPEARWVLGEDPGPIGSGDIFITPSQTLPLDVRYRLIDESRNIIPNSLPGLHLISWMIDNSMENTRTDYMGRRIGPEAVILSAAGGIDLFDLHWRGIIGGKHADDEILPAGYSLDEHHPGVFMGTYPSREGKDILVSGRTAEQAISYLLQEGIGKNPCVDAIRDIYRDMNDSSNLFDMIDRRIIDPYYLQKIFKLSKIENRLDAFKIVPGKPSHAAVHLIKTALRRGIDPGRIGKLMMDGEGDFDDYLETLRIRPRLKYREDMKFKEHVPLIVAWPEIWAESVWALDLPAGRSDPGIGFIKFEILGDGDKRVMITSDPAFLLRSDYDGGVVFGPQNENLARAVLSSDTGLGSVRIYTDGEK